MWNAASFQEGEGSWGAVEKCLWGTGCSLSGTSTGCQVHMQINTMCVVSTMEKDSLSQDRLCHFLVGNHIFLFLSLLLLVNWGSRGRQKVATYIPCQEGPKMKHTMSLPELLKKADVLQTNRRPWCRPGGPGVAYVSALYDGQFSCAHSLFINTNPDIA